MAPTIAAHGLRIQEFPIGNIGLPQEVEKMLDRRTSMRILGDLDRFGQSRR
ncbi:antifreeze protein, partial [Paracoccus siganidrum]